MTQNLWEFIDKFGTFFCKNAKDLKSAYLPLVNEAGIMSSITPELKGDIKLSQDKFLMAPLSSSDIKNTKVSRNFWVRLNDKNLTWSATGVSSLSSRNQDKISLTAGLLWHKLTNINKSIGLKSEITNFVPASNNTVEIMSIKLTNISKKAVKITSTSAIPIYARSAENLRDHRHVTSLLNRIILNKFGVIVKPTMVFNEKGHFINNTCYFVLGAENNSLPPVMLWPIQEEFTGANGDLENPDSLNSKTNSNLTRNLDGKDAIGALRFKTKTLAPQKSVDYLLIIGIAENYNSINTTFKKFNTPKKISTALEANKRFWLAKSQTISFSSGNDNFDNWLRWVNIQPVLRKIFGCSFLPHFDYGKGNRGWRDIWQDYLALILNNNDPKELRKFIIDSFSGIRIDGTNATIVTKKPGEFIADRNSLPRVWMDHGLWPYFTLELYLNYTNDLKILFAETCYFKDRLLKRAKEFDKNQDSSKLLNNFRTPHRSTILEHVILQHLVQFFNVGKHNNIRLENADWNDGLDMAPEGGESAAFSSFYGYNLERIASLLDHLRNKENIYSITLTKELGMLLDTLKKPINYENAALKRCLLEKYLEDTKTKVSGQKIRIPIEKIIFDLAKKSSWIKKHINGKEWINLDRNKGFFNGYYDNKSKRVEGMFNSKVRILLESQVFPILAGGAGKDKICKILAATRKYLLDKKLQGLRLNTDFEKPQLDLGRAFSFSYGDKENGAIFSHMSVMFAYALFKNGFNKDAWEVLSSLYSLSINSKKSKIYPCLPEYFNLEGNALYSYLTGSASWFIFTLLTQFFGIRGEFGDLRINPKFTKDIFKTNKIGINFKFCGKDIRLIYKNHKKLAYPKYKIVSIKTNAQNAKFVCQEASSILIKRPILEDIKSKNILIEVKLG